jgi:hypothetical protein
MTTGGYIKSPLEIISSPLIFHICHLIAAVMTPTHMRVYTIAEKIRLSPIEGVILARSI